MKNYFFSFLLYSIFISCNSTTGTDSEISIAISFSDELSSKKLDGRMLLMLSTNNEKEPRFQIGEGLNNQLIFGMNVNELSANEKVNFNEAVFGFPVESLQNIKPGTYYIQALLNIYETFHLKTGQIVKLPMDNGEGQQWNKSPGNIYSKPVQITVTEKGIENMAIVLNQIIPEITQPEDTEWIKHVTLKSEKLSKFWGRDMYLGAHVLLPKGFNDHPEAKH